MNGCDHVCIGAAVVIVPTCSALIKTQAHHNASNTSARTLEGQDIIIMITAYIYRHFNLPGLRFGHSGHKLLSFLLRQITEVCLHPSGIWMKPPFPSGASPAGNPASAPSPPSKLGFVPHDRPLSLLIPLPQLITRRCGS